MRAAGDNHPTETDRDQAVEWLVRVQSDLATGEDWAALSAWLEESPEHQQAFDEAEGLSHEISLNAAEIAVGLVASQTAIATFTPRRPPPRSWPLLAAAAAAAAILVVSPLAWTAARGKAVVYQTAVGQTQEVVLADGSRVRLNSASRMTVRLGWLSREVRLDDAEASFDVAKDPGRPFVVAVGDQQVRVVGTEFNIRHHDGSTTVTVRRGVVEVRQPALGPDSVARLTPGRQLSHVEGTAASTARDVDPNAAFAWASGQLVYDQRSLVEVVADLNRRFPTPVRLTGSARTLRFSGVLSLGDQEDVLRRLAAFLSISVHRTGAEFVLG